MTNRNPFRAAALLCLFATLIVGPPRAAHADALDQIRRAGVLTAAVPADSPPFGSIDAHGVPQGYDVDTAALLAHALGVKLELVPVTSAERIPALLEHRVDVLIASFGKTRERERALDFSVEYAPYSQVVYGPPDIVVRYPADLVGKRIGATRGALEEQALSALAPPGTDIRRYADNNATMAAFADGRVDLIAVGDAVGRTLRSGALTRSAEIKLVLKVSPCYVAVNKGEAALLQQVDAALLRAKQDGELNRIALQWLGMPLPEGF